LHPTHSNDYVFINQDVLHVNKRTVNALAQSNPTNSYKRGMEMSTPDGVAEPLCLQMVQWCTERGSDWAALTSRLFVPTTT